MTRSVRKEKSALQAFFRFMELPGNGGFYFLP